MFKCNTCLKIFSSKYKLDRHLNKKIPCTRHKNECYKCGKILSTQQSLYVHRKSCQKNEGLKEVSEKYPDGIQEYPDSIQKYPEPKKTSSPKIHPKVKKLNNIHIKEKQPYRYSKNDITNEIIQDEYPIGTFIDLDKRNRKIKKKEPPKRKRIRKKKVVQHNINKIFSCEFCGKEFTSRNNMYRHKKFRCKNIPNEKNNGPIHKHYIYNQEIRSYGDENMDWIKDNLFDIADRSRQCQSIADFVNLGFWSVHFNNKYLENQNVRIISRFDKIRLWAEDRGLYDKGDTKTQTLKLIEEAGEICRAILKNDKEQVIDGIGDCVVVLTNLARLSGTSIEHCIDAAYDEIKDRTGKMSNGTFKKD